MFLFFLIITDGSRKAFRGKSCNGSTETFLTLNIELYMCYTKVDIYDLTQSRPTGYVWKKICILYTIFFFFFVAEKQQHSRAEKHNFPVCKKISKWYHSIARCRSYDPLRDDW